MKIHFRTTGAVYNVNMSFTNWFEFNKNKSPHGVVYDGLILHVKIIIIYSNGKKINYNNLHPRQQQLQYSQKMLSISWLTERALLKLAEIDDASFKIN